MIGRSNMITAVAGGLGVAALLGYCIYFDRKRRSHPEFKQNLIASKNLCQNFQIKKNKI